MVFLTKLSAAPALLAAFALTATPLQAAEFGAPGVATASGQFAAWVPGDDSAEAHRRHRYRHRGGVDAGDILAGVLILGGIAAIANAAENSRERYPQPVPRGYPDPRRGDYRYDDGRGIDRAVTLCVDTIERDVRVDTVDAVNRHARGWTVTGSLFDGQAFSCSIGTDGRIEAIDYGASGRTYGADDGEGGYSDGASVQGADRQHGDAYYAAARARSDTARPTYPGGPLPGEDAGAIDGDIDMGTGYPGRGG